MKIIESKKFAKTFNELYDYIDDDTVETLDQYEVNDQEAIDWDALERGVRRMLDVAEADDETVVLFPAVSR